jgi:hypothetical protein
MASSLEKLCNIRARSNEETCKAIGDTFLNLNPDFQRDYEAWGEKMCTRLMESVLLGRAMNPVWVVANPDNDSHEVLDGKHRLTTLIKFMDNEIVIGKSVTILDNAYIGKKFNDLSVDDKNKIRNYNISMNHLDASYRSDENKLYDMYEILNRSSQPLNMYELKKPKYNKVYCIITKYSDRFLSTPVYSSKSSKRGDVECDIMSMIALSEYKKDKSFSSMANLMDKWIVQTFGDAKEYIDRNIAMKKDSIEQNIERILKYMGDLFSDEKFKGSCSKDSLAIKIIVSRLNGLIADRALFKRHLDGMRKKFYDLLTSDKMDEIIGTRGRNAGFQKALINYIDGIIMGEIDDGPRLYTRDIIDKKKVEQGNKCALCSETMTESQKIEGDHIIAWIAGGKTTYDNLQVVHADCHRKKEVFLSEKINSLLNGNSGV